MKNRRNVPAFCTSFKTVEYLLCIASAWAAITLMLTPTLLRQNPPPFFDALKTSHWDWRFGALCLAISFVHFFALKITSCQSEVEPCEHCERRRGVAAVLRSYALLAEFALWFFLTACYVILAVRGTVTLASGLCVLFAVCASLASYCLSREMARHRVHLEARAKGNEAATDSLLAYE